ncbi:MAG: metallophosphoesterase [Chitinivibrionales bacterium]|nr:metallophosphoesterase [Chitinivibrionales bacterium]
MKQPKPLFVMFVNKLFTIAFFMIFCIIEITFAEKFRFAIVADCHINDPNGSRVAFDGLLRSLEQEKSSDPNSPLQFIVAAGDPISNINSETPEQKVEQLRAWYTAMSALGVPILPIRGNHNPDAQQLKVGLNTILTPGSIFDLNSPSDENMLTYYSLWSFGFLANGKVVASIEVAVVVLDGEGDRKVPLQWLNTIAPILSNFAGNNVFFVSHRPLMTLAKPTSDRLGGDIDDNANRVAFLDYLQLNNWNTYICGHEHFSNLSFIRKKEGKKTLHSVHQATTFTSGGVHHQWNGSIVQDLESPWKHIFNPYIPLENQHYEIAVNETNIYKDAYGYMIVEIDCWNSARYISKVGKEKDGNGEIELAKPIFTYTLY